MAAADFNTRIAQFCAQKHALFHVKDVKPVKTRALDIGCAVGRACFELSRDFDSVVGIDYSHAFVDACNALKAGGVCLHVNIATPRAHTCAPTFTHIHTMCTHIHTHSHTCAPTFTHMCSHIHTHVLTHSHTCAHTFTHMCTHRCAHTFTFTFTFTGSLPYQRLDEGVRMSSHVAAVAQDIDRSKCTFRQGDATDLPMEYVM
jgi:hypothetical protein